ncbi:BMP family lipoprotein [Glycomyces tarimensis]
MAVKPYKLAVAGVAATGLFTLSACGEAPEEDSGDNAEASFQACMVTDSGGVDDKSFNESSWAGMQAAAEANDDIESSFKESSNESDYAPNLQSSVDDGCDFIVGVGGLMTENVNAIAEEYPDTPFAIVDGSSELENVYSIQFDTAQSAFLAGYVAAAQSETGTVATWGGMQIPPVTIFMDGFVEGVAYHNENKDTDVEVLGWDAEAQEGSFLNSFEDPSGGKSLTETFISQGADIVHPVAGPAGTGAVTAASENESVAAIWVDVDGCESLPDYCSTILTSAEKNLAVAVEEAVTSAYDGTTGGSYIGTLENDGVSLAPFHEFEDAVSDETKTELEDIKAGIIDGSITVESPSSPAAS